MGRRTILESVTIQGPCLHSGGESSVVLVPAEPGYGIRLNGARVSSGLVISTELATTLGTATGPVRTVEHLFAALHGHGIDDVDIVIAGDEVPILDGSAEPWRRMICPMEHGIDYPSETLQLGRTIRVGGEERWITAEPAADLSITVQVAFESLGTFRYEASARDWRCAAPARTFGFLEDRAQLNAAGLGLGANLDNTLVFDKGMPMNPGGLRFPDEVARHKWLDLFGDLVLLGKRINARIFAHCAGHRLHHQLVDALLESEES